MAYCTPEEVLGRMGFDEANGTALVTKIDDAIDAATTAIDNDTSRSFELISAATKVFGEQGSMLRIPDLTAIDSLKLDDNDDGVFEVEVASTGYELDTPHTEVDATGDALWPFETLRLLDRNFPTGGRRRRRIEIVGDWGWAAVPAPINQACSLLAARLAQRPESAVFGVVTHGELGSTNIQWNDPDYLRLIKPYRHWGIA